MSDTDLKSVKVKKTKTYLKYLSDTYHMSVIRVSSNDACQTAQHV